MANISWTVVHTSKNHIIFSKCVARHFSCIYVNCLKRLRFFTEVSIKLQKMHFFGQFQDHNSGKKHENYTNDPIFFIYFFRFNSSYDPFLNLKLLKNSFSFDPRLWSILVCRIAQFFAKIYRFRKLIMLF